MGASGQRHAPAALYPRGKDPRYPLYRRLSGPQSRSGHRGYRKNALPLLGIEPRSSGRPARSQTLHCLSYPAHDIYFYFIQRHCQLLRLYAISSNKRIGEWWIGKDVEGSGRGLVFRYYPGIFLERLMKTTENLSQDSRFPGRDLNSRPAKYEGVLTARPTHVMPHAGLSPRRPAFETGSETA
jgi:hypothetical protein